MSQNLEAQSRFSYQCNACGKCCFGKRIQTNPYEVLRLARNRGMSTGSFMAEYLEAEGPYLKVRADRGCVFLDGHGCGVHNDRPLVCRTYPLGRTVDHGGRQSFGRLDPYPGSQGIFGRSGTVAAYLRCQGADEFNAAGDRLQALFYRYYDALQKMAAAASCAHEIPEFPVLADCETNRPFYAEWFDVDRIVEIHCASKGLSIPTETDAVFETYLAAMMSWLETNMETNNDRAN